MVKQDISPRPTSWKHQKPFRDTGVITGGDRQIEYLIPWWLDCFKKHSRLPVLFCDLGLSPKAREWVSQFFELLPLDISQDLFKKRFQEKEPSFENLDENARLYREKMRIAWFKKPFILLQTPFKRSLWLDIDCEVQNDINPLFAFAEKSTAMAALTPAAEHISTSKKAYGLIAHEGVDYNAGVIPFLHGSPLIPSWAEDTLDCDRYFPGDQEILAHTILERKHQVALLPRIYNWQIPDWGTNRAATIQHWKGGNAKHFLINHVILKKKEYQALI
ncbi:hypothetical protein [Estrella lausannensis]|uniref:Glycosyltransferase n=1 Tax=Estrella lausannensis TaxID=483423 RepID=A0A0H5DRA5_9BACT|nr:hypothetical protein [Estrella lausannensis]CRX38708.1 hypothetical protein ELAC_1372 [Estrella lausannensis]